MREEALSFLPRVSDHGCFHDLGQREEMSYLRLWTLFKLFWVNICINSPPIEKTKDLECKYEKGQGQGTDVPKEKVPWCQRHLLKYLARLGGLTPSQKARGGKSQKGREKGKESLLSTCYAPSPFPHCAIPQDQGWTDSVARSPVLVCYRPSESQQDNACRGGSQHRVGLWGTQHFCLEPSPQHGPPSRLQ